LRLKILKKLRTASLNSEFTGSYKKSVEPCSWITSPICIAVLTLETFKFHMTLWGREVFKGVGSKIFGGEEANGKKTEK